MAKALPERAPRKKRRTAMKGLIKWLCTRFAKPALSSITFFVA